MGAFQHGHLLAGYFSVDWWLLASWGLLDELQAFWGLLDELQALWGLLDELQAFWGLLDELQAFWGLLDKFQAYWMSFRLTRPSSTSWVRCRLTGGIGGLLDELQAY